ncbi:MAG: hypothetical protein IJI43_03625 [Bacilli bacterium]|nr:hypothetical protein [Bacilli bacterium]
MNKKDRFQNILIGTLIAAVLFMTIGFAAYSRALNINGTATFKGNKWSVHFDPDSFAESTGSVEGEDVSVDNTLISFSTVLEEPGDFYEFDIDVVNDGSFDARLTSITLGGITSAQSNYISYVLTYDGTPYDTTTSNLSNLIAVDGTKAVHVKVLYVEPADESLLPEEDVEINLTATLSYEQVE